MPVVPLQHACKKERSASREAYETTRIHFPIIDATSYMMRCLFQRSLCSLHLIAANEGLPGTVEVCDSARTAMRLRVIFTARFRCSRPSSAIGIYRPSQHQFGLRVRAADSSRRNNHRSLEGSSREGLSVVMDRGRGAVRDAQ